MFGRSYSVYLMLEASCIEYFINLPANQEDMEILYNSKFLKHNIESEAEGAYRLADFGDLPDTEADGEPYFGLIHSPAYIESIRNACINQQVLAEVSLNNDSWEAAKTAVGLSIMAAENSAFAAIRPPGHHAGNERASGFCFFNNIAIATQKLVNEGKRVFIFDIDGHHGDGTQSIFYGGVMFFIVPFTSIMHFHIPGSA